MKLVKAAIPMTIAAITIALVAVVQPLSAQAAGTFTSTSALTTEAPDWLQPAADRTVDPKRHRQDPAAHVGAELPYTGLDLLPETVIGVALVGTGLALRARRA